MAHLRYSVKYHTNPPKGESKDVDPNVIFGLDVLIAVLRFINSIKGT